MYDMPVGNLDLCNDLLASAADERRLLIVGGGFAGITLARQLERRLPRPWRISLLSQENYIIYYPLLAEVVGASILPGHVVAPLRQVLDRTEYYMVKVTHIDLQRRTVHYAGQEPGVMAYDQLVLACGVMADLQLVPGMAQHALPFKTLGDALFLRNRIIQRLEEAEMQPDPELRRWLTTFIIIGGGFSGVELAGEISDFLHTSLRYYRRLVARDCRVILLHGRERILQEISSTLSGFALRKMRKRGIDIRLTARARCVDAEGVALASGEQVYGATVIATIGSAPHPLIKTLPLPKRNDRIETQTDMSVPGFPGIWALGDCAAVINALDGRLSPPTAQFATRQAKHLARNIAAQVRGKPTRPFSYRSRGQLASIGHNKAVAELFGLRLSGFVAWLLWRGLYLLKMPTLARKVRIFFAWNWEMLFRADTVRLQFSRTHLPRSDGEG